MPPITPAPTDIPDDAENVSSANVENPGVLLSDSDSLSDGENLDHNGYELLSQDPENVFVADNDDEDCNSASDVDESPTVEVNLHAHTLHKHVVAESYHISGSPDVVTMDDEHIETIKSVMKGITLPHSNLPQWASLVPEDEWKSALLLEMQVKNATSKISSKGTNANLSKNNNQFDLSNEMIR